jgi:putative acetyltransferase
MSLPALETTFLLRDSRSASIRPARPEDYPSLMDTLRAVAIDDRGVVRTLAEMPQTTEDTQREFAKWQSDTSRTGVRGCWFVALLPEGRVIGEADVRRMSPVRLRHVAHLGLSVHPKFQRLGVGRALMQAAFDWCISGPGTELGGISRVDLNVLADNDRAIAMYKSLGFEVEGRRRRFIRREDGTEVDDLVMARLLND